MTLEEAKKILEKEGFKLGGPGKPGKPGVVSEAFTEYESPEICEAMQIVCSAGFQLAMLAGVFNERKERLKKEYEKNTKAPGPGEEQPKEKKGIIYPTTFPKADFYHKHVLNEGNPALKESASQFNDALLDEQAKKIAELTKENEDLKSWRENQNREISLNTISFINETKRLGKEIARLNGIIHKKNMKIDELKKESSEHLAGKVKLYGETVDLSQELCDKNEDIRLSKIREKNLVEVSQKYMKKNEELKKELADKVVDKIDAQALKSAESALAYKEKVIAEKDEVIADLGNELEATKKELEAFKESYKRRIKEDSEHFEHIQKICNAGLQKWLIESEYLEKDKPFRFPQLPNLSEEEEKKLEHAKKIRVSSNNAEEGADLSGVIVICGKDFVKKFRENEESLSEFLKNIEDEAVESMSIESGHLGGNESFGQMEALKPSQRFKQAVCDARLELLYFIS